MSVLTSERVSLLCRLMDSIRDPEIFISTTFEFLRVYTDFFVISDNIGYGFPKGYVEDMILKLVRKNLISNPIQHIKVLTDPKKSKNRVYCPAKLKNYSEIPNNIDFEHTSNIYDNNTKCTNIKNSFLSKTDPIQNISNSWSISCGSTDCCCKIPKFSEDFCCINGKVGYGIAWTQTKDTIDIVFSKDSGVVNVELDETFIKVAFECCTILNIELENSVNIKESYITKSDNSILLSLTKKINLWWERCFKYDARSSIKLSEVKNTLRKHEWPEHVTLAVHEGLQKLQ